MASTTEVDEESVRVQVEEQIYARKEPLSVGVKESTLRVTARQLLDVTRRGFDLDAAQ